MRSLSLSLSNPWPAKGCSWRCNVRSSQGKTSRWFYFCEDSDVGLCIYLSYLLTPWSKVLPEKRNGFQLVKNLPAFYGTQRIITAFTNARHLSLSSVSISASNCITKDTTTEYLPEWKATCSNGAIWCATLVMYKISAVVSVTHFKVLIHLNSLEENYWLAANQIMSGVLQKMHTHLATLMSIQRSVTHYYFPCCTTAFIVNKYPQVE